jgi:hypothetical protein
MPPSAFAVVAAQRRVAERGDLGVEAFDLLQDLEGVQHGRRLAGRRAQVGLHVADAAVGVLVGLDGAEEAGGVRVAGELMLEAPALQQAAIAVDEASGGVEVDHAGSVADPRAGRLNETAI